MNAKSIPKVSFATISTCGKRIFYISNKKLYCTDTGYNNPKRIETTAKLKKLVDIRINIDGKYTKFLIIYIDICDALHILYGTNLECMEEDFIVNNVKNAFVGKFSQFGGYAPNKIIYTDNENTSFVVYLGGLYFDINNVGIISIDRIRIEEMKSKNLQQYYNLSVKKKDNKNINSEFVLNKNGNLYMKGKDFLNCKYKKIQENVHEIFNTSPYSLLLFSKVV